MSRRIRAEAAWFRRLGFVPAVTLAVFLLPIAVGIAGTLAPAFGVLPALGASEPTILPWRQMLGQPGVGRAVAVSLLSGASATLASLALTLALLAAWHGSRALAVARAVLAPLLALPHAAAAIGIAFLLAPSGWIARALSPWATGWQVPPDAATIQDPWGLALAFALVVKEVPFLLLMALAGLGQIRTDRPLAVARTLGYGPVAAWAKVVLGQLYPLIRLPVYAVLAYSLSVVDMALVLGPTTPPTLAVMVLGWTADPDPAMRLAAAAGACLQLLLVAGAIGLWRLAEIAVAALARGWLAGGRRGGGAGALRLATGAGFAVVVLAAAGSLAALAVWSLAGRWSFPAPLPQAWSLAPWARAGGQLAAPVGHTAVIGLAAAAIALALAVGCLEHEQRAGVRPGGGALWLLYLPLLVPQIGFLFGVQVLLVAMRLDGTFAAVVLAHLLFVLPYVFLALADPWRALDPRYARAAACLGASPSRILWHVKLPILARPLFLAAAIGFAVSATQYLPTLFAGAGRVTTLAVEAVGLAAGADRRAVGVFAFLQAGLPLVAFALALAAPRLLWWRR